MSSSCSNVSIRPLFVLFFFNDTATTEIYTLSLHDALPICSLSGVSLHAFEGVTDRTHRSLNPEGHASSSTIVDRKSTRLNSSHANISYAVFCLKKKKKDSKLYEEHKTLRIN